MSYYTVPPLVEQDPYLEPYTDNIRRRIYTFKGMSEQIKAEAGSLLDFANAHTYLGFNYDKDKKGWFYREWLPEAYHLYLTGDFNNWSEIMHPLHKKAGGIWEIFLDDKTYKDSFKHESLLKIIVEGRNGKLHRLPAFIKRVVQDEDSKDFKGQLWHSAKPYKWKNKYQPQKDEPLIIYEAHAGMAQEYEGVGTYREFADDILPHIKKEGYTAIQLMAIQEHPYYGSFGYHVSNFFAPSSRFGTPEDLKYLIDKAHGLGLAVIMDLVHSHAVKNINEGLNNFDGSGGQYFRRGDAGEHPLWDSKIFDYQRWEVVSFLLSNVRYWLEDFQFDGFRFDGVTSMLYHHHGFAANFNGYDDYFGMQTDDDSVLYLQLANAVAHKINKNTITIAEDVSGMPGLCRPTKEGGVGFDYRLAMGLPDYWIKTLKEKKDEDWSIHEIWHTLLNRRSHEKHISYAESHDQALEATRRLLFSSWIRRCTRPCRRKTKASSSTGALLSTK